MSKVKKTDKYDFLKLIMSNIEYNSSTTERAKEYLKEVGYNVDAVVSRNLAKVMELQMKKTKESTSEEKIVQHNDHKYISNEWYWTHPSVLRLINESQNRDPISAIKDRAREAVIKGFEMGWEGPPYDPIALARLLNIDIFPNDQVADACIRTTSASSYQIQYNPQQKQTRINFSVAHEIAHTLFSDCAQADIRHREQYPTAENRQLERLCNAAAAEIQLPYAVFSHDADIVNPSMKGLIELAMKYKASLESVFIRYTEVINRPCAVIIGIFDSVNKIKLDYHTASKSFPVDLNKDFNVPIDSGAFDCYTPGHTAEDLEPWVLSNGMRFYASSVGISAYRKDNKPRVGILLVPEHIAVANMEERKVIIEYGDATKPRGGGNKIIAQVVNTSGALGAGFGKSLSKNYPQVKDAILKWKTDKSSFILGNSNFVDVGGQVYLFQMLAQKGLMAKNNEIPLKYDELRKCLIQLRIKALEIGASVHMPAIGAGQAGGDWNLIVGMIHDELSNYNIKVHIYLLPGKPFNPKQKSSLTLFNEPSTWETKKLF
ncbi:ImmA/IrrE family metallo-endopeptidase [Edaphocola flava]|uniref:ImmA/IrrE family metallo-endopeptidase n=1 Tax=Edaphocola flava TaxID=2499629 RepID=UPI00100A55AE|nr:ImmA/IrrE family metallo-endopeptidase [Edaphocola flava]